MSCVYVCEWGVKEKGVVFVFVLIRQCVCVSVCGLNGGEEGVTFRSRRSRRYVSCVCGLNGEEDGGGLHVCGCGCGLIGAEKKMDGLCRSLLDPWVCARLCVLVWSDRWRAGGGVGGSC